MLPFLILSALSGWRRYHWIKKSSKISCWRTVQTKNIIRGKLTPYLTLLIWLNTLKAQNLIVELKNVLHLWKKMSSDTTVYLFMQHSKPRMLYQSQIRAKPIWWKGFSTEKLYCLTSSWIYWIWYDAIWPLFFWKKNNKTQKIYFFRYNHFDMAENILNKSRDLGDMEMENYNSEVNYPK